MAAIRVLLIEDDNEIARRLASGLAEHGFIIDRTSSGAEGYEIGRHGSYDAVVLDLGLPGMQGLAVLRRWRGEANDVPVLILSAHGTWSEKVDGLNAGADDYVTKPFHTPEVAARLKALVRRRSGVASTVLSHGDVVLDATSGRVSLKGEPVEVTAREFKLLSYFMHRIGRLVSQPELVEHIYADDDSRESNTIEVYVSRLRRKLGADIITTVRGLGYRMD